MQIEINPLNTGVFQINRLWRTISENRVGTPFGFKPAFKARIRQCAAAGRKKKRFPCRGVFADRDPSSGRKTRITSADARVLQIRVKNKHTPRTG